MTETAGAVHNGLVLRMSVPASGALGDLGPELGVKLAEQIGVSDPVAANVGTAMIELARALPVTGGDISYAFHKDGAQLRIDARQGDQTRTITSPLSA